MSDLPSIRTALEAGDSATATRQAREFLSSVLTAPQALLERATAVHEIGLPAVAEAAFRRARKRRPTDDELAFRWSVFRLVTGHPDQALAVAESLQTRHDSPELHAIRGLALRRLGRAEPAALAFQAALKADPTRVEWWGHVGDLRLDQRRLEDAIRAYNAGLVAAQRLPDTPSARVTYLLTRLADCFARSNLVEEAWQFSERAIALQPGDARARWNDLHLLPIIYEDMDQVTRVKARYQRRLGELDTVVRPATEAACSQAVASMKLPFYLHYHGGNLKGTMARYGGIVDRILRRWQPSLAAFEPPPAPTGRIRVGFASSLFRRHTITKLFGGWIRGLDRSRFEVFAYHLGPEVDETTRGLEAACDTFRHLPSADAAAVVRQMRADELHATVFPELGMAMTPVQVAAMRTAPVQAVAWGHPVTTGLPAVDFFLSSEAMEPGDGDEHYTERLIRLPGLSITPSPPIDPSPRDRASFGFGESDVIYLVPQSLFKLLPDEDSHWCDILERVPDSRLALLHHHSPTVTGLFQARVQRSMAARGLDPSRLVLLPHLDWADYLALNRCADVFLDGLSWSGGMTTLEAIAMGLVPVTCPGDVMRARHTAAILRELGVDETIAETPEARTEIAVRLGLDPAWRASLQARLRTALPSLYEDHRGVEALERTLSDAVSAAYQRNPTVTSGAT